MKWMADVSLEEGPARKGFGFAARRYAASLPSDLNVIIADFEGAAAALSAAVERRRQGRLFYCSVLLDDIRALASIAVSGELFVNASTEDERRCSFDALADDRVFRAIGCVTTRIASESDDVIDARARVVLGLDAPLADASIAEDGLRAALGLEISRGIKRRMSEAERRVLRDFVVSGDALLARSRREADRVVSILGRRRPLVAIEPGREEGVPCNLSLAMSRSTIVVWAPEQAASSLGVIAMALESLRAPVVYVCSEGSLPGSRGSFVRPDEGVAFLEAASVVVDAAIGDPAPAIALARHGFGLVTSSTSGAAEFIDGVQEYDPWNWRSVHAAVSAASGGSKKLIKARPPSRSNLFATLALAAPVRLPHEPLVTVIMATRDRPYMLDVALQSLAMQTYKNIEVILINNGTADVSDVVRKYHFVQLIEPGSNVGIGGVFEIGLREMAGEYFCALADDDINFPDFIARLVFALERSGAFVAHGNTVTRYFDEVNGSDVTAAYRVRSDRALDPLTIICGATMTMQSMMFRRKLVDEIGAIGTEAALDLDYQIRAGQRYDFIHVDFVTCLWNHGVRAKSFNTSDELARGLENLFERYPSSSKVVERMRGRELTRFGNRSTGVLWAPDLFLERNAEASSRSVKDE